MTQYQVPVWLSEEILRDTPPPFLDVIAGAFETRERERDLRGRLARGETLPDEDAAWLAELDQQRAERSRKYEERAREARANALTVGQLAAILADMPQDAPLTTWEVIYNDAEQVWADEHVAELRSDGTVHLGA